MAVPCAVSGCVQCSEGAVNRSNVILYIANLLECPSQCTIMEFKLTKGDYWSNLWSIDLVLVSDNLLFFPWSWAWSVGWNFSW